MPPTESGLSTTLVPMRTPFDFISGINFGHALTILFTLVFVVWIIYSLIAAYHWVRFGHRSWFAVPLFAAHLFISGFLFVFMTAGLH